MVAAGKQIRLMIAAAPADQWEALVDATAAMLSEASGRQDEDEARDIILLSTTEAARSWAPYPATVPGPDIIEDEVAGGGGPAVAKHEPNQAERIRSRLAAARATLRSDASQIASARQDTPSTDAHAREDERRRNEVGRDGRGHER